MISILHVMDVIDNFLIYAYNYLKLVMYNVFFYIHGHRFYMELFLV